MKTPLGELADLHKDVQFSVTTVASIERIMKDIDQAAYERGKTDEREACAAIADRYSSSKGPKTKARPGGSHWREANAASAASRDSARQIARAIRARS